MKDQIDRFNFQVSKPFQSDGVMDGGAQRCEGALPKPLSLESTSTEAVVTQILIFLPRYLLYNQFLSCRSYSVLVQ